MADYNILQGSKGFADYRKAEQEFNLRKQLQQAQIQKAQQVMDTGANLPAALQIANEYAKAREAGDIQRMNDIALAAKSFDKGVAIDAQGAFNPLQGYGQAVGNIEGAKSGMKRQAEKDVDLVMNPQIAEKENYSGARGKSAGEFQASQDKKTSNAPNLEGLYKEAEALLPLATSGRGENVLRGVQGIAGVSTAASQADKQLDIIAAQLTGNVPRFEGPQSNIDVRLYESAAGDLANRNLPSGDRVAALQLMRKLNNKYMGAQEGDNIEQTLQPLNNPSLYEKGKAKFDANKSANKLNNLKSKYGLQ